MTDTPDARPTVDMLMQFADDYAGWAWNLGKREQDSSGLLHLESRATLEAYARRLAAPVQPETSKGHLPLNDGLAVQALPLEPTPGPWKAASVRHIIRCLNAHDELVAELRKTADFLQTACLVMTDDMCRRVALAQVKSARKALAAQESDHG